MLGAGASAENLSGGSYGRFSCAVSSVSPQHQKTVRILYVSLYGLDSPSSVTSLEMSGQIIEATASEGTEFSFV